MVTITYNANGGEGEMKPQAVESGVEVKLSANTFTKDGSDFTGWNEAADGSGKAYADGATVTPTGNLTLYAQWQVKSTPENPGTEDPGTEDPDPEQPGDGESDVDLRLTRGTAVFVAELGLKLPFTVGNTGALTQDELTELLESATKTVTLFTTADDGTGTQVQADHISHGVDIAASTPYILVAAAAFPRESETVYSKIEVVLQAEGYVTQTLPYAEVSVNSKPPVSLENHITNTAFIAAVEAVYPSIGWSKTEDGYVDMTVEANQTAVTGVESLDLSGQGLTSSEGLEYFTGLKQLTLSASKDGSDKQNALTELDVSALTALTSLVLDGNPLTALPDLTNQSALVSLNAASCGLTAVSGLPASLMILNLSDNELTALDVSALTNLANLLCYRNQMNALDITTLSSLNELYCGAQKTEGDLSLNATSEQLESLRNLFEGNVEDNALLLLNSDVVWIVPAKDFDLTAGTAVFNKTTGLTLPFSGSTLPADASASVSLNGTQVDSQFNVERTAVIVAPAALTNDTVDMTVTVTVSAAGYNDAELTYSGVNTVWMPENVTAALADSEAKIGGETVTVTVSQTDGSDSLDEVKILSGTYSNGTSAALEIGDDGLSFTAPILENAAETGTAVTVTLVLGKENAAESDTVTADNLSLTVYPSTHVRYDGRIFKQVKGFDFSTENTAKTAGVQIFKQETAGQSNSWAEDSTWSEVQYMSGEGYQFATTSTSGGMRFVFPETDGDLDFELIMVEAKWNNSQANLHMSYWYESQKTYGYSFYKTGKSFFMVGNYNFDERYGFNADVTENTFNRFYAFDNGTDHSGRVNDGEVHSFTVSAPNNRTLDTLDKLQLEFSEKVDCTYTLKTVAFYKPLVN